MSGTADRTLSLALLANVDQQALRAGHEVLRRRAPEGRAGTSRSRGTAWLRGERGGLKN